MHAHLLTAWLLGNAADWRSAMRQVMAASLPSPCSLCDAPLCDMPRLLALGQPDVVLWDREARDWISVLQILARRAPHALQVVVGRRWTADEESLAQALGVHHCLSRVQIDATLPALLRTRLVPAFSSVCPEESRMSVLTAREQQIVEALQNGLDNKSIARLLGISPSTVKTHLHHVFDKLGTTRTQLLLHGR
ncbi:helix-turn-helix transcriptional regulator [Perlucidibaca piscinae]|uniref:helix-turn-helix transcriptional regulator n=1 Tax=Perlucidibaca piscinae TaxID=392589 RepID=UPI0003B492CD|nr:LuxR C-terminal-related transcriptional regulator [Perlucidibaca piscinae]